MRTNLLILTGCVLAMGMGAQASSGQAFGDPYGNTRYLTNEKTPECGYGDLATTDKGRSTIRVAASPSYFRLWFAGTRAGYSNVFDFSVRSYGNPSQTSVGEFTGYVSDREFVSRTAFRPPYEPEGEITLTEHTMKLNVFGLLTYTKAVNGQVVLTCNYRPYRAGSPDGRH